MTQAKGKMRYDELAEKQMIAMMLNVAGYYIHQAEVISADGATVSQAINYSYELYCDQNPKNDSIASNLGALINSGLTVPAGVIPLNTPNIMYKGSAEQTPESEAGVPKEFELSQNYPNPFNPATEICFALPQACPVKLEIFNVLGQRVATLVDGELPAGYHRVTWDARTMASGVYMYRLTTDDIALSKKMLLLK